MPWIASFVGMLGLLFVSHLAWVGLLSTHFIGGTQGDSGLYVWLAASFHADPIQAVHAESSILYPYPLTRAWSDSFLLPSAIVSLLISCGLSLERAYNTLFMTTLALNGLGVIALARTLKLAWIPSFCAGSAFACSSYLTGNFGHPQLQFFFWVPLAWACVLALRDSEPLRWFLAGVCVSASFYCAVYYALFAALGLGFICLVSLLPTRENIRAVSLRISALALGLLPIGWLLPSYLQVKSLFGSRGLYEADAFAASGLSYLSFSSFNRFFGNTSHWTHNEATLCAGFVCLSLALVYWGQELWKHSKSYQAFLSLAVVILVCASSVVDTGITSEIVIALSAWIVLIFVTVRAVKDPSSIRIVAAVVALFFVLSFGPAGNPHKGEPALAPFAALYYLVPGIDAVRAVSRCGSVVVMGIYIFANLAVCAFFEGKRLHQNILCALLLGITLIENHTPIFPLDPLPARPEAFETLSKIVHPNEAAIALPFSGESEKGRVKSWSEFATLNTRYALWGAPLQLSLVNGYSGQRSKIMTELPAALQEFPSFEAHEWLSRICGLRWIIVVPSLFRDWDTATFERRLREHRDRFVLETAGSDGSLLIRIEPWTDTPKPFFAPASKALRFDFLPPASECAVQIYALKRDQQNAVTENLLANASIPSSSETIHIAPNQAPPGHPQVLQVRTLSCSTAFRCSVEG
jgi:hypothetical protein